MSGRGGAGNILAIQQENARISADLEANQSAADSYNAPAPMRSEQQYAHSGRGGAGNYYSPKQLSETGQYRDTNIGEVADLSGRRGATASEATSTTRTYGRGGVGNYAYDASENQEKALRNKMQEDEEKQQKLKADIEAGVKETLAMPEKAKLPGGHPY
ncbi:Hypothetical predicted protein [Lecanosticta acicola]|uniref:Uncharacterized protein n=1 Tax=Lecanosticta acicola TaxID=111012 RepID=A0AAI8Z557_9PEZI|nr:Hypothetical predicted protein [Lecanosticta acicola]